MSSQLDTALLTVEQAAYKWCPEGRTKGASNDEGEGPDTTVNRSSWGTANAHSRCLGDDCMFWRWHDNGDRHQSASVIDKRNLIDEPPKTRKDGTWYAYLPQHDDGFDSWKEAVECVLGANDFDAEDVAAFTREGSLDDIEATDEIIFAIIGKLTNTDVIYRLIPPALPPRGYCGKGGHPHAASLIDGQLELLRHQLWEHQHAA